MQNVKNTQTDLTCMSSRALCIHANELHSSRYLQFQLVILVRTQSQNTSSNKPGTWEGKDPPILSMGYSALELSIKRKTQRNSEEWALPKAQGRSMTRAIKEQLLLNSFLPRRTILAGGAWLTESSAASDQLPAVTSCESLRLKKELGLCSSHHPWRRSLPHQFLVCFSFRPALLHFLKKGDQRQCPETLGWSHISALREGDVESMLLKCLSAPAWLSVPFYASHLEGSERSCLHGPLCGSKGIFSFPCTCITSLLLSSPGSSLSSSLGCSKCLGSWAVNYITGVIEVFKKTHPKTFNGDGCSDPVYRAAPETLAISSTKKMVNWDERMKTSC